jgi:hypothetical protein
MRLLPFVALLLVGCLHVTDAFEGTCIKGQITQEQADEINAREWQRNPGYCNGNTYTDKDGKRRDGTAGCKAQAGDRILSGSCSQGLKSLKHGD